MKSKKTKNKTQIEKGKFNEEFKALHCRMFENEYPRKSSLVYVNKFIKF